MAWSLLMAALWMILALRSPTTTYHFAPLAVALAWPAYARFGAVRARWLPGVMSAGGAAVLVALASGQPFVPVEQES